jgi:hypothetical protein
MKVHERSHRYVGDCDTVREAHLPVGSCCSSCHEDVADGYELVAVYLPNGDYLSVCCRVAEKLFDMGEDKVKDAIDQVVP